MVRNRRQYRTADLTDTESDGDGNSPFDSTYTDGTDGSDTDLTEPEIQNPAGNLPLRPARVIENPVTANRPRFADPPDDTDEDLSDIASDHDQPDGTKRLRTRVVERWQRFVVFNVPAPTCLLSYIV
jgi:hypothetical protein